MIKAGGVGQLSSAVQPWSLQDKPHGHVEEAKDSKQRGMKLQPMARSAHLAFIKS